MPFTTNNKFQYLNMKHFDFKFRYSYHDSISLETFVSIFHIIIERHIHYIRHNIYQTYNRETSI